MKQEFVYYKTKMALPLWHKLACSVRLPQSSFQFEHPKVQIFSSHNKQIPVSLC